MAKDNDRFVRVYKQGVLNVFEVYVDRETGVNYILASSGYGVSFIPLLDKNGNIAITNPNDLDRMEY